MTPRPSDGVGNLVFLRPDGTPLALSDFRGKVIVLIFLRHLACSACRDHLFDLQKHYGELQQLGAELLVVSFSKPASVANYLERYRFPFPVVADPSRDAYKTFALKRASWKKILRPGVIFRYLKIALRGHWPRWPARDEDVLQLGGDFVLDRQGRLIYAHPSTEPTDRPTVQELLKAVRSASSGSEHLK